MITDMGFTLPAEEDFYNIQDFNNNFKLAENNLKNLNAALNEVRQNAASEFSAVNQKITNNHTELTDTIHAVDYKGDLAISNLLNDLKNMTDRFNAAVNSVFKLLSIKDTGILKDSSTSLPDVEVKTLNIVGYALTEGLLFGVKFQYVNANPAAKINIHDGSRWLGAREIWNEKGRIGTSNNNNVIGEHLGKYHIFRYNSAFDRYTWVMVLDN